MNNDAVKISVNPDNLDRLDYESIYNPTLNYAEDFYLSSIFDCSREMEKYSGDYDYHSLMHKVQKPVLTANKVEALSLFANKLLLRKYKKYKWGVGSNGPSRKRSWRQEIMDAGSGSACGEYSHCWSCRSFSFTFETWHKQLDTNEFLSGFLAD